MSLVGRKLTVMLAASAFALLALATPASAGPGMGWGQWTSQSLSFAQCMARTPSALRAEGYATVEEHGRFWFGSSSGPISLVVACYGLAKGSVVTIVAGSIVGPQGQHASATAVQNLADRIFGSTSGSTQPTGGVQPGGSGWTATAVAQRGKNGQRFSFTCPSGGSSARVWGTDSYTDDSSVCTAAVHAGFITLAAGGTVTIEIRPGASSYAGSSSRGITTTSYGAWSGSFVFVGQPTVSRGSGVGNGGSGWGANAAGLRGQNGQRFSYTCPAGGSPGSVWGVDSYTDDSSVCTAAVHAGFITLAAGGTVTVEIRAGASSYTGSTRNGITTNSYGVWGGSFVFVNA